MSETTLGGTPRVSITLAAEWRSVCSQRWKEPLEEPAWFDDLHPVARELHEQNGDVPLLIAEHLRGSTRRFTDLAEIELFDTAGNRLAKADLIAHADGRVIVVEAKSNDELGSSAAKIRAAARKRALIGAYLVADEILLGTTQPGWGPRSVQAMTAAIRDQRWASRNPSCPAPAHGLGTEAVTDEVIDLDTGQRSPRPAR